MRGDRHFKRRQCQTRRSARDFKDGLGCCLYVSGELSFYLITGRACIIPPRALPVTTFSLFLGEGRDICIYIYIYVCMLHTHIYIYVTWNHLVCLPELLPDHNLQNHITFYSETWFDGASSGAAGMSRAKIGLSSASRSRPHCSFNS